MYKQKINRRGVRRRCCYTRYSNPDKTTVVKLSGVKGVSARKVPDEVTGKMEVIRNHKYNTAIRYWTLEKFGTKTRGDIKYYTCDRHEFEILKKDKIYSEE